MKPVFENPQMVRGVVVAGSRYGGLVSRDNDDCAVARTLWYRHDDDLDVLERELEALSQIFMKSWKCDGVMISYEYKNYREV